MASFAEPETEVEYVRSRWAEGESRTQRIASGTPRREAVEDVIEALVQELEKRIGQVFSTLELASLQEGAEAWSLRIAHEVAPEEPRAWELDTVQDAAFHRYSRRATDYQLAP